MPEKKKWIDRSFSFDLQIWMYPNIVERLRGTPARVEERIGGLPAGDLTRRDGGKWSIQEHAGHLLDLEELWLERLSDFEKGSETLTPADLENRKTHEANHNAAPLGDILAAFRARRSMIVRRLDGYGDGMIVRTARHPRLGTEMQVLDLAYFVAEHDDHHLARITELIGRSAERTADPPGFREPATPAGAAGSADSTGPTSPVVNDVLSFINAINSHDVDSLASLMSGDHVLVDPGGRAIQGIDRARTAWESYLRMFPDYRISVAGVMDSPPWITVVGSAGGTFAVNGELFAENSWSIPAAWLAGVRAGRIFHWQVYTDNEPVRRILERYHGR